MKTANRPEWTGDLVRIMHIKRITRKEVADEIGVTNAYITLVLNGRDVKPKTKTRIESAIYKLAAER